MRLSNPGPAAITGLSSSISAAIHGTFEVTPLLPSSLAAGQTVEFKVRFTPQDSDEASATLQVLAGGGIVAKATLTASALVPDIEADSFANGATFDAGTANTIDGVFAGLMVYNHGLGLLTNIAATIAGPNASEFKIETPLPPSISPGTYGILMIKFLPGGVGARRAVLRFASNDPDENPYLINLVGTGSVIELSPASADANYLLDRPEHIVKLGSLIQGSARDRSFRIKNRGTFPLKNLRLSIEGPDAASLSVVQDLPRTLTSEASAVFTLRFTGGNGGARSASVRVLSDPNG